MMPKLYASEGGRDGRLLLSCAAFCVLAYGYNLFNFTLPIDGENKDNFLQTISLGRWAHSFIRNYLLPEPFLPYFTNLVSLFFLSLTAFTLTKTLKLNELESYFFAALFITFPALAYQFEFINQSDTISIGYFLAALSAYTFIKGLYSTRAYKLLFFTVSFFLLISGIAIYQALALVPIVAILSHFYIDSYRREDGLIFYTKSTLILLLIYSLAIATYYFFTIRMKHVFLEGTGGANSYLMHYVNSSSSFSSIARQSVDNITSGILGDVRYGFKTYAAATLAGALTIGFSLYKKSGSYFSRSLLAILIIISPFLIIALSGSYIPGRVLVATNIAFATIIVGAFAALVQQARVAALMVAIISLINISSITALFYSDTAVRQNDIALANRIATVMMINEPEFDPGTMSVYFHGGIRKTNPHKLPNSDVFGSSFFTWDYGNNRRIVRFFSYYNIAHFSMAGKEEILNIKPAIERMPVWPNPKSVGIINGVMVVKLHEKQGYLPFKYD